MSRGIILELTYQEGLHRVYKEVSSGLSHLCAEHDASKGTRAHDKPGREACGAESVSTQQGKETAAKCVADLKLLAKKAQVQPVLQMHLPQWRRREAIDQGDCTMWRNLSVSLSTELHSRKNEVWILRCEKCKTVYWPGSCFSSFSLCILSCSMIPLNEQSAFNKICCLSKDYRDIV